ncbi:MULTISPECIES: carbamoyltransferase C-terminal domain-containing protein [unclassified Carboxylicivirga]|uniref:carbamoyltransferase C-terminal domain-containing protein n=1 Tax=Carboxylicivirga TaxID=1628153 RepID=UPI003D33DCA7
MNASKPTLAIYGIQDRISSNTPFYVHDHALSLMHKGKVLKHLTLERLSRRKHDNRLHEQIYDLLKSEGLLKHTDYDLVFVDNVVGRSFISSCGRFRFEAPLNTHLSVKPERGRCWWLDCEKEAYALNHELAHIAASLPFYGDFKDNSLLIHFDGGASVSNFSAFSHKAGVIKPIEHHWEMKHLSSLFNANALVFGIIGAKFNAQNSVPGKMMGLAAYGQYRQDIEDWLVQHNYFADIWASKKRFFEAARADFGVDIKHLQQDNPFLQDILATMQGIFQRELLKKITQLQAQGGYEYLYYAGGSALNIVANTNIVESGLFKDVSIPPCTEDSGLSLGAAAYFEWIKHGSLPLHNPYLNNWQINDKACYFTPQDIENCAAALMQNKVIAICNNAGEIGPRALGNRSILSLANNKKLADKVSMTHKKREWYRPVAPIMLEHNARYFTGKQNINHLAKYMLLDFEILADRREEIAGVVHVDGTARIQTVNANDNPYIYALLMYLDDNYGIKALINTSFNVRGEPIVHDEEGAVLSAKNMQLDAVVLNGKFCNLNK